MVLRGLESVGRTEDKSGITEMFPRGLSSSLQGPQAGHSAHSSSGSMAQDSRPLGTVHVKRTATRVAGSRDALALECGI